MPEITPPDKERCQARVPTGGPFQMGGPPGDPRDGYRRRCDEKPTCIITENKPGEDGLRGHMSLCDRCLSVFLEDFGEDFATITPLKEN